MVETEGFDLRCGAGQVAALERPRRSIHFRSGSNPMIAFQKQNSHPFWDDCFAFGGDGGIRTLDLTDANRTLSPAGRKYC